ncbi:TIGR02147 family protein [Peredibacter starrii]|uniref:TIGR02147 family protein n=1 Tax=Peredibacter starrii TaxID=28202 RepID=A0AAX4HKF6_9BACT|nr:TIGR02147 family protein [Peredibacter starrii]WPU63726.1 TIGR02147 family protein [Peredibacter starrii]
MELSNLLQNILDERRKKNQSYSMRAFARDLSISSGRLSDIINRKYVPGAAVAERIIGSLELTDEERPKIRQLIEHSHQSLKLLGGAHQLQESHYAILSDWHHYAILNLMETNDFQSEVSWISARLNLAPEVVEDSLSKLLSFELIERREDRLVPTHKNITTTHEIPSEVIREGHRQVIMQSLDSLEMDPTELRDITSITLPVNVANLPRAKELARDFRRKIATLLEEGDKTEVYNICVQIVPVTRKKFN